MDNTFKHNSRSYFDVYNPLVQAYPSKPTWLFKEMAGEFDFQSELMNRIATDILYPVTRESAYAFAARCDYTPSEAEGCTVSLTVTLTSAIAKTLAVGRQFGGISTSTGAMVIFEVITEATSGGTSTITCNVAQKASYTGINFGTITSQEGYADYPIDGYTNIVQNTMALTIAGESWTSVTNFDNSTSTDRHFRLIYQSSGKVRYQFGDGTNGKKPTLNDTVYGDFAISLGLYGRMGVGEIDIDLSDDPQIDSVTNAAATSGGSTGESVASILRNSRANARLREMVWSQEDLELAARASSSSVTKALGIPGIGVATIHIIPTGGGNPSTALKTIVDDYVTARTQFGSLPITVSDPTYVVSAVTANITVRSGFTQATVINLVKFAMTLTTSAFDNQVLEYYDDFGIDDCRVNVINVLWSWAFTSNENDALSAIIDQWKTLLGTRAYREWGQPLEVGDLWIMGNNLYTYGVDVFDLTLPTTNTSTTSSQIISTGTVTVT